MSGKMSAGRSRDWRVEGAKTVVEDCRSLDANHLMRQGVLRLGRRVTGYLPWPERRGVSFVVNFDADTLDPAHSVLWLHCTWTWVATQQQDSARTTVSLTTTRPRSGGLRWWFRCPLGVKGEPCGRRVGKLHLPPRARDFGCRHCHQLTYRSCQESHLYDGVWRWTAAATGRDLATLKRLMKRPSKRPGPSGRGGRLGRQDPRCAGKAHGTG
jgi:hypothetical protein